MYDIEFLKDNPVFFSRLGFCYDPPLKDENGEVVCFTKNHRKYAKFHDDFAKNGVRVNTCILHSGWVEVNEYDYSLTDTVLEELFLNNPEGLFIPRVKLNVPVSWCKENPSDVFLYYESVPFRDKIADYVGTLRHDYLGYVAEKGYYQAGEDYKEIRPNVDSLISMQSFSSKKWQNDAWIALERLIDHIEEKYSDRIIGYHIAYGACGESMLWGRQSDHYGDYGINNLKYFYGFALKKYGSHENTEKQWGFKFDKEDVFLPPPEKRYPKSNSLDVFFRKNNKISVDYDEFSSETNSDALIYFCRKVKEKTGKLTGAFYGYMNFMPNANYAGHLAIDKVLASPYVDFLAAPKSYYRSGPGDSGGYMCPIDSYNRKKQWMDELDNRTYLSKNVLADENKAETVEETFNVLFREFSKNLSHDASFLWMDLGGGWLDSPEIHKIVRQMVKAKKKVDSARHKSTADVLVITDEAGMVKATASFEFIKSYCLDFMCELNMSGVLSDIYRLSDLAHIDISQYKLIIFAYCFAVDDKTVDFVNRMISENKTVMFNHASGIWLNDSFDIENVRKFTGFSIEYTDTFTEKTYPSIRVNGEDTPIVYNGKRIIYTGNKIDAKALCEIAKNAGCHIYGNCNSTYYGDNRFLGVFSGAGENTITFKEKGDYEEIISGKKFYNTQKITVSADKAYAGIFLPIEKERKTE